jgi:hypothetical protein
MPIPKPGLKETESKFINRCMSDAVMTNEYSDQSQRAAVCHSSWDNRKKKKTVLQKIADIVYLIKADKYDKLVQKLANLMVNAWDEQVKEYYKNALRKILAGRNKLTQRDINKILKQLKANLGADMKVVMTEDVTSFILDIYRTAQKEIIAMVGGSIAFNLADKKAIKWLGENTLYWIGEYYSQNISESIGKITAAAVEEGLDRSATADLLRKYFTSEEFANKSKSYWEGLSNHVVTRGREFGHTESYVKAKVTYVRFVAVMDHRTSPICQEMNGKIIPVSWMVETRDKLINAKTPEESKEIAPWLSEEEIKDQVIDKPTTEIPHHLCMPPLHWRCRSRTVRSTKEAWDNQTEGES